MGRKGPVYHCVKKRKNKHLAALKKATETRMRNRLNRVKEDGTFRNNAASSISDALSTNNAPDTYKTPGTNKKTDSIPEIEKERAALNPGLDELIEEDLISSYKDDSQSCNEEDSLRKETTTIAKRRKTQNNRKSKKMKDITDDQTNEDVSGNQEECALYTQLLCKKLQTLKETTREIAMLEIDRYIYNLKQQEKSNLVLVTPTQMDPLVGQYSPRYHLSPNSEYSSVSQHTPEYKTEYPINFSPNSSQQTEEQLEIQASCSQNSQSAS